MGCGCGRGKRYFLVTMHETGDRKIVTSETDARISISLGGGGGWIEIDEARVGELKAEGVPVR